MRLIEMKNVVCSFGERQILGGVSLQIGSGEKIGLIGANGCGKTTLLKILAKKMSPDQGDIFFARNLNIGYLSQIPPTFPKATLETLLKDAVAGIYRLQEDLAQMEKEMSQPGIKNNREQLSCLMEKYGRLSVEYEVKGGYHLEAKVAEVVRGMGFTAEALQRTLSSFSGGEKTRAQIGSLILQEPDLLLLDEPTNNLDAAALEWLESYLKEWRGAVLVVSHDRIFLDRVIEKIAFLETGNLHVYAGNYTAFTVKRQEEEAAVEKNRAKQQAIIKKQRDFILNASAEEKRRAQSREKQLDKIETDNLPYRARSMQAKFDYSGDGGKKVLEFNHVDIQYKDHLIFKGADFQIYKGDRVAVVGPNGAGKTTLLRLVAGVQQPSAGNIVVGAGIKISYFTQEQENLIYDKNVLENILAASNFSVTEARSFSGRYLFRGEEVFKKVSSLSIGERSRLALAVASLSGGNLLLLDEPTNYLDIQALESLEEALLEYPGTLIIVSHDRYFLSRLSTRVLEVGNGQVKNIKLPFSDYMELKKVKEKAGDAKIRNNFAAEDEAGRISDKQERLLRRKQEKAEKQILLEHRRKVRIQEKKIMELEEQIHSTESRMAEIGEKLADPVVYEDFALARSLNADFQEASKQAQKLLEDWEAATAAMEALTHDSPDIKNSSTTPSPHD